MKKGLLAYFLFFACFQLAAVTLLPIDALTLRVAHAGLLLTAVFLTCEKPRLRPVCLPLALCCFAVYAAMLLRQRPVALSGGVTGPFELALAGAALVLLLAGGLVCCRDLTLLACLFLLYNFAGPLIPGLFGHSGFSLRRVLRFFFWGSQGIFGVGANVSSTYLFVFVLFGALLRAGGFTALVSDLALRAVGGSPGAPAKIAVLSSALLGTVNGSAVANVATTGALTIPLMKQAGYPADYAAAVEATASTGGQFMPPVMGAVGFVMAELLGTGYGAVMAAALLPALLYYGTLLLATHLWARRLGLQGQTPPPADFKNRLHLLVPLLLLLGLMCLGYTPLFSCVAAIVVTPLVGALRKETRLPLSEWLGALAGGARDAVTVGVCCLIIGIIIGTVTLTGVGLTAGAALLKLAQGGNLLLCGTAAAALCLLLGTGVPGVAAYVIVAAVAVPSLVQAGALPICAHLFCLFYACFANLTPPVAISATTAAGIAGSSRTKTALHAMALAAPSFLLPLFFLLHPALLLGQGDLWETLGAFSAAAGGSVCLTCAAQGWLCAPCTLPVRLLLTACGLLFLVGLWPLSLFVLLLLCAFQRR